MATDIKLDEAGGEWVVVEGAVLKTTASDFMLDAPARRRGGGPHRRALVHNDQDGLTINLSGDYPGGVTVVGPTTVAGDLVVTGDVRTGTGVVTGSSAEVDSLLRRVGHLELLLETITELVGVAVVPGWRTLEEVENGDDMGVLHKSAEALGLVVEFRNVQNDPRYGHEDVVRIIPDPGTIVRRGSTVVVVLNLEG